jgi:hypothetical protein
MRATAARPVSTYAFETFSLLVSYDIEGTLRAGWYYDADPLTLDPVLHAHVGEA